MSKPLVGLLPQELEEIILGMKQPKFRAKQFWGWLHKQRVDTFDEMKNIPAALRTSLAEEYSPRSMNITDCLVASDELTRKWLFECSSTEKAEELVETVLITEKRQTRQTVCVSSMIGCPIGCVFCATGHSGYERNLSAGEIVEQCYVADAACRAAGEARGLTNIVFMGMGEPLLNYDEVLKAARIFASDDALGMSGRHITISTVGVIEGIERLARENVNYRLALSLHSADQVTRDKLIPGAKNWPLDKLLVALQEFNDQSSRDMTIEYCLIEKVNDSLDDAKKLVAFMSQLRCKLNLIPLNPIEDYSGKTPSRNRVAAFQEAVERGGISVTVRQEKGRDINAACGQLRSRRKQG